MHARPPRRSVFSTGHARRLLAGLAALVLAAPGLRADIQQPPRAHAPGERRLQRRANAPAAGLPGDAQVAQGGSVPIILHASGQEGKSIDFQIRVPPAHGTLSGAPVRLARDRVSVLYVQNPGDDVTDDEFTFSVQAPGSELSAPETVHVRIMPAPAVLVASPLELDFGAVKAGDTARGELTLENRGGSEANGQVNPPTPWFVDGSPDYHLARGASQTFQLVFRPKDEQVFADMLHFNGESADGGVRLVGTGLVEPGKSNVTHLAGATTGNPPDAAASGNGALTVSPVVSVSPAPSAPPAPTPATASVAARDPLAAVTTGGSNEKGVAGYDPTFGLTDRTQVPLNEAAVKQVSVRGVSASTVDLAWKPPTPRPASYRVEIRYVTVEDDKIQVEWRPYALVEVNAGKDEVTAHLRGLPSTLLQMIRVVAVDSAGRLASPSPMYTVQMKTPSTRWNVTPLKVLIALLILCGGLAVRKRWEDQQILREIDESRRVKNEEAGIGRGY